MKIIIFGAGIYYERRKDKIPENVEIVAFADNNIDLQGGSLDGVKIISPSQISLFSYEYIVLMSVKADEMKAQLLELGIDDNKILYWEAFYAIWHRKKYKLYGISPVNEEKKKALIIHVGLNYDGGTMAAIYAALALQMKGFSIVLAAPGGNEVLIEEIIKKEISVAVCSTLQYINSDEIDMMEEFDVIVINTFQMIRCACEISKRFPVLWWIHENSSRYDLNYTNTKFRFSEYDDWQKMQSINVIAVSSIARNVFNSYYPNVVKHILPYGIPDERGDSQNLKAKNITFAVIGTVHKRKAQDVFINAIKCLAEEERNCAEFLIVGKCGENSFCEGIKKAACDAPQIKILGELTREEMKGIYQEIDVVVCSSLEETMSIAVTEGMMHGKTCITTDATGMAEYIVHGENGFVCKAGDERELYSLMRWCIQNREKLQAIGINARKTYEEEFTLEKFSIRLEKAIEDTVKIHLAEWG